MSTTIVHIKTSLVKYSFKKVFLYFVKNRSITVGIPGIQGHVAAARDLDDGGIHIGRLLTGQKDNGAGNFFGTGRPAQETFFDLLLKFIGIDGFSNERRPGEARHDGQNANSLGGHFPGQGIGIVYDGGLHGPVERRPARSRTPGGQGRYVDDDPSLFL